MFKNLFKKLGGSSENQNIIAPASGKVVDITQVPDPVFSEKMMGEGVALIPNEGTIVSPVDGEVIQSFNTKHAIALRCDNGLEILIHIGLETVKLNGEGFEIHVNENQKVKAGDTLVTFDIDMLKERSFNIITPVIIVNADEKVDKIDKKLNIEAEKGTSTLMEVYLKN